MKRTGGALLTLCLGCTPGTRPSPAEAVEAPPPPEEPVAPAEPEPPPQPSVPPAQPEGEHALGTYGSVDLPTPDGAEVMGLDFAFDGTTLWVGWLTTLDGEDSKSTLSLAGFARDLSPTHPPRILRSFEGGWNGSEPSLLVRALQPGGVAVAALAGRDTCRGLFEPKADCTRLHVELVGADGATRQASARLLDGGQGEIDDLLVLGDTVVTSFHVWHGGPLTDVAMTSVGSENGRTLQTCGYPPIDLARVDAHILALCPDPERGAPEALSATCSATADTTCGLVVRVDTGGRPVAPSTRRNLEVPLAAISTRCVDDQPTTTLRWDAHGKQPAGEAVVPTDALTLRNVPTCAG